MTTIPVLELLVSTQPGGGPQHVLELASGLRGRGWQTIVAGPAGPLVPRFAAAGAETLTVASDHLRPWTLSAVIRHIRRRRIQLVHSHGKGAGVYARLAARATRVPAVHTFHGIHYERYPGPVARAYLAAERRLSRWTAAVINVSRAQEAEGLALRLFTREQSRVIVNGVPVAELQTRALPRPDARRALGVTDGRRVVGCVARFDEVKRLDLLLRAVAALPAADITTVLVGAGAEEPRLRALAATLGLDGRVVFAGEVPDAARLLRAFDVFAAPSRKEGMPLAVLEAMALSLPVVASDIPAHREVLAATDDTLVAGGASELARVLSRLLADPAAAHAIGERNRARVSAEFDARTMVDRIEAVYRAVLGL